MTYLDLTEQKAGTTRVSERSTRSKKELKKLFGVLLDK